MKILERSKQALELWQAVVPFCLPPDTRQFIRWANRFPDDFIEHAIMRAGRKFNPDKCETPDNEIVHRYVSGIMLNMEREADENAAFSVERVSYRTH